MSQILTNVDGTFNNLRVAVALVVALFTCGYYYTQSSGPTKGGIPQLSGPSLIAAWRFFETRYDFLWSHFPHREFFQFRVLQHKVVALRGEEARKVFFADPHLNFNEGYKILMGAAPLLENVDMPTEETKQGDLGFFNKYLIKMMHKDRLRDVLPTLFNDVNRRMVGWGKTGRIDPFEDVYDLVFQMTARLATCRAISEDKAAVDKIGELFMKLQKSATPASLLLPWFPSSARKLNQQVTTDLYVMLSGYVDERRKAAPNSDAIDILIAEGFDTTVIVGWVLGVMFAGVLNTGINACWILINLAVHTEWKQKVIQEANDVVNNHLGKNTTDTPLHERLSAIPLSAWEDEMPVLESCIQETLRIAFNGTALRRNINGNLPVGDKVIENGAFMAYSLSDVHLNDALYPDPEKFDPARSQDNSKTIYPFLGWGVGRHPCAGMKVAKLEMKMVTVLFVLGYEFTLVDKNGKLAKSAPLPDRNDVHQTRPLGQRYYLDYKRVVA